MTETATKTCDFRGTEVTVGSTIIFQSGRQSNRWLSEATVVGFVENSKEEILIVAKITQVSREDSPWHQAQVNTEVKVKPDMVTVLPT